MKNRKGRNNGLLPSSLRIISSCLKTVSSNASNVASSVRSAGASVAASISASSDDPKDQVTWAGFDKLELGPTLCRHVLLLGYQNGFQVLDVEDASNFSELVSKRDGPVTFLQMQPFPTQCDGPQGYRAVHPILLVVSGESPDTVNRDHNHGLSAGSCKDGYMESELGHSTNTATTVQFYSLKSHAYVHVLRFRSAVCMVRCSPRIVAVGLAAQIHCFDAVTLENKFSVLTYPVPQLAGQGPIGVNFGYGPMAVGPRWLAYASNNPLSSNTGRLSPQNLTPSPGVSPSTSPSGGNLVARYAMESSKHLAAGIINLGDMGYKTLSKYCQELLPDGSNSPVPSSSGWKVGRHTGSEPDNAGMVVIKDFVSRAVICQFKAHTSPLSALCFDPSGTLLVTASVYGNTINVFRIMPCHTSKGSGSQHFNWISAHVHLYRLHRGMTSAIIQDICFSHYSQWVGIVSSKGTCHVFVLSPFGGDPGFLGNNSKGEEVSLFPSLSIPWWSNSYFINSHQCFQPPPPVTLSVVSRIKYNDSGWLNTVSNAAASATGKVFVPSGAVAAVFHNSMSQSHQHVNVRSNALEYLLVYTPSGHVIQHKLLPSIGVEASDAGLKARPGSFLQIQEDELRVKVEPVQWWDVCRRSDWPEREDCRFTTTFDGQNTPTSNAEGEDDYGVGLADMNKIAVTKKPIKTDFSRCREGSHWYLSNAEVQVGAGRIPFWHRLEVSLYTMSYPSGVPFAGGEFEVEKLPVQEVEIKRKELLPVFDHFHSVKSGWGDRSHTMGRYPAFAPHELRQVKFRVAEETVICHSKPSSLSSTESSDGGSSRRIENFPDFDQVHTEKSYGFTCQSVDDIYDEKRENCLVGAPALLIKNSLAATPHVHYVDNITDNCHGLSLLDDHLPSPGIIPSGPAPSAGSGNRVFDLAGDVHKEEPEPAVHNNPVDLGQLFKEGYCGAVEPDGSDALNEAANDDVNSCSPHEREKPEDGDDEMLGGIFAFSEDGKLSLFSPWPLTLLIF
ncbi:hypothetical protein CRG98_020171 [Punica granatum]|uniref:Uncharacterized protein n=2 Tax=Punica granatum TaxID=22663 RepID=A0A2I0JT18_PUNGR|nr:hypothetical protein CRG98_020171 [Punica granatum]